MVGSKYLDDLARVPLFAACSRRDLQKIARAADELSIPAGRVLMNQGERGHEAFVIVDGTVSVDINGIHVADLGPGACVGEMALLDGGGRTATVTAATDLIVLVLSHRAFTSLIDEVPGLGRKILAQLAAIVRDLDRQLGARG